MAGGSEVTGWMLAAVAGFAISAFSYRWAVACAKTWGEVVKSAFDCYLPSLIKQLGYAVPPTEAERKAFWEQFNAKVLYQFPMQREWPPLEKVGDKESSSNAAESDAANEGENSQDGCASRDRVADVPPSASQQQGTHVEA